MFVITLTFKFKKLEKLFLGGVLGSKVPYKIIPARNENSKWIC